MPVPDDPDETKRDPRQCAETGMASEHRPFDTSALGRIPRPTADDPPYREWWALDEQESSPRPDPDGT